MPYYSELGIYTPSSSYSNTFVKGPYSNHSSILASNILPPSVKQFTRNNFRGFRPHLTTISESAIIPLQRISSPKLLYHSSPKVKPPRPVKINTADIDVSLNKYKKYDRATNIEIKPSTSRSDPTTHLSTSPTISRVASPKKVPLKESCPVEATPSTNIKRNRRSIRLQTVYKDTVDSEIKDIRSWRDNFKPEELVTEAKVRKKTPGEVLKEKFLIRSKSKENISNNSTPQQISEKSSIKKSSSFKDICHEISSDQFIEDLNPGQPIEVRRRQSRQYSDNLKNEIKRSSLTFLPEDAELLDAIINAEADGLLPPEEALNKYEKGRKKKYTRKRSSEKLTLKDKSKNDLSKSSSSEDLSQKNPEGKPPPLKRKPTNNKIRRNSSEISIPETGTSRLRKDSSLTNMVKDISQVEIEMIPTKPKPVITAGRVEIEDKPNLKAVVDDVEIQESPKPISKKEKRFRFNVKVEELPIKKKIYAEKIEINNNLKGVVQLPNPKKPILTSILKKHNPKQAVKFLGEPKVFEKKEVKKESKPLIAKSRSEVLVQPLQSNIQRSESGENVNYTILTTISKTKSSDSILNSEGNKKLKIMSVEKQIHKKDKPVMENKTEESEEKSEIRVESDNENVISNVFIKAENREEQDHLTEKKKRENIFADKIEYQEEPLTENKKDETVNADKIKYQAEENVEKDINVSDVENMNQPNLINKSSSGKEEEQFNLINKKTESNSKKLINTSMTDSVTDDILKVNSSNILKRKDGLINNEILESETEKTETLNKIKETTKGSKTPQYQNKSSDKTSKAQASKGKVENIPKDENDNTINIWDQNNNDGPPKIAKLKVAQKDPKEILKEIQSCHIESEEVTRKKMMSKRSLIQKANKDDPDLEVFEPPDVPDFVKEATPERKPSWEPLQNNRLSHWMHPWKKPEQNAEQLDIYAKPKYIRVRHIPRRWRKDDAHTSEEEDSDTSEDSSDEESEDEDSEVEEQEEAVKVGASTSSNDSGFHSGRVKDKSSIDNNRESPGLNPAQNPAFALDSCDLPEEVSQSSTYQNFQKSGRITPPATTIPRFRKYCVDDFNFLKVLGKGSFGKVLLAELKGTEYYYAIKCLKKDVVLEDDDVECTLIERKVLALGTKHPYLCHLLCTFQTESHLFFVMEYLNGGDLMFHIQVERRFSEARARFYGAEIVSGLRFLHNKGIVYRDLKLDNILLDFDGHVRIADFGMCKLQIFLDRMADTFCGTPDYMAPEIIKGQHYNQCADWWSFGVLLYEMLLGQSPFSGCDEDELFWSICNEKPVIPRFLSAEASSALVQFLDKDANRRLGNRFSVYGDIQDHPFFKPIDWVALEARKLEPPFKPNLQHPLDTQYFDRTFTTERAKLTPIENQILTSIDQTQFQGFSYTNPNATDK